MGLRQLFVFLSALVNILLMVAGIGLLIAAMYVGGSTYIKDQAEEHLPSPTKFDNYLKRWGIEEKTVRKGDRHSFDELVNAVNNGIFYMNALGVAMFILGILGVAVSTGDSLICGIVFLVFLVMMILCIIYVNIQFKQGKANEIAKQYVKDVILPKYKGARYFDISSLGVNTVMNKFSCCGITDYKDFKLAKKWENTYTLNGKKIVAKIPLACCKLDDTFPEGVPKDPKCITDPNSSNAYIDKGCGVFIDKLANKVRDSVIFWTSVIIVIQVVCGLMFLTIMSGVLDPAPPHGPPMTGVVNKSNNRSEQEPLIPQFNIRTDDME